MSKAGSGEIGGIVMEQGCSAAVAHGDEAALFDQPAVQAGALFRILKDKSFAISGL
ncbi:hypothetical protein [Solimonas terrae]|uniref:Uncharacterized protein n=1 Tax=Solimonas terrae TaxID=1396819 RepID=A0A6M2BNR9_9GAMM|nr:hypothetical protein [Solimonas terrae]NGY03865.1 hypothetical protein [Solimonas terrae]